VYHGATAADRRRAHHALGEAGRSELRTWHLATAALAPDEELAAELQHTAERAGARGGYAASAALLRRSADLTPDDARRAEREVALAGSRLMAGDPAGAQSVLGGALPRLTSAVARGRARRLEGAIRFAQGNAADAARILASASRALAHDDRMARDTMLEALEAAIWAGPVQTREIARAAAAFPRVSGRRGASCAPRMTCSPGWARTVSPGRQQRSCLVGWTGRGGQGQGVQMTEVSGFVPLLIGAVHAPAGLSPSRP
jgi:hypothetical protein